MDAVPHSVLFWSALAILGLGLTSMVVGRSRMPVAHDWWGRVVFFSGLLAVGVAASVAITARSNLWLAAGTLLATMAVGATWEPHPRAEAF